MTSRNGWRDKVLPAAVFAAGVFVLAALSAPGLSRAGEELKDPLIGDSHAIDEGRALYRRQCFVCHLHAGGRGPNLFASRLSDEEFAQTVLNGRGMMPAWGLRLSLDDVWKLRAYVRSTDRYGD